MRQLTIAPDSVPLIPYHIQRAGEDSLISLPLEPALGQYEYLPTDSSHLYFVPDLVADAPQQFLLPFMSGDPLPFSPLLQTLFFLLFLLCFLLFAFFYNMEGSSFRDNFRNVFLSGKFATLLRKEQVTITEAWGELFLIFQTMLIATVVIFNAWWDHGLSSLDLADQLLVIVSIMAVLSILAALKVLSYRLIGTFFLSVDMKRWVAQYTRMLELIGIVLFLPAVCFVFLPEYREPLLILFVTIFLVSRMIIIIGLLHIFVKNKIGGFYFFVYLCGTEIAPLILLYKGVITMVNIAAINII